MADTYRGKTPIGREWKSRWTRPLRLEHLEPRTVLSAAVYTPVADTFVQSGVNAYANFGNYAYLIVRQDPNAGVACQTLSSST